MTSRLAATAAAATLAGLAVLSMGAPAFAQAYDDTTSPGASDETVVRGQSFTLTTGDGECTPRTPVTVDIEGRGFSDDRNTTATDDGTATIQYTVPQEAQPGRATATFRCPLGASVNTVVVPFTVVAAAAAGPGRGQLPLTGSDALAEIAIGGAALVAVGVGLVVVARRRRGSLPTGLA